MMDADVGNQVSSIAPTSVLTVDILYMQTTNARPSTPSWFYMAATKHTCLWH